MIDSWGRHTSIPTGVHHLIEHLSNEASKAPTIGDIAWWDGSGMITACPHGWVLREGYPKMPPTITGRALVDLAIRSGRKIYRSSLPAHCNMCAQPEAA